MTWEVDIVQRAGRKSISGEFRLTTASEAEKFIARLKELVAQTKMDNRVDRVEVVVELYAPNKKRAYDKLDLPSSLPLNVRLNSTERNIYESRIAGFSVEQISEKTGLKIVTINTCVSAIKRKIREARS